LAFARQTYAQDMSGSLLNAFHLLSNVVDKNIFIVPFRTRLFPLYFLPKSKSLFSIFFLPGYSHLNTAFPNYFFINSRLVFVQRN